MLWHVPVLYAGFLPDGRHSGIPAMLENVRCFEEELVSMPSRFIEKGKLRYFHR